MSRKLFCLAVVLAASMIAWTGVAYADGAFDPAQIKAILRTATVEEENFIDKTVAMVNDGELPADLFESTLEWAQEAAAQVSILQARVDSARRKSAST